MTKQEELEANARGEGCLGRSQLDEPVFILCGRDPDAGAAVRKWADDREMRVSRAGLLDMRQREKIAEARRHALTMDAYARNWAAAGTKERKA